MTHIPTQCNKDVRTAHYHNKSWSFLFTCPGCGRSGRFNTNFLGRRNVECNGEKFTKVAKTGN